MNDKEILLNPRVIVVQKLYGHYINKESEITFTKHRYKKFIKDVVLGTIERKELIQDLIDKELKEDINQYKTEIILKLMIAAAIYEFMFMHKIPIKVVISEYLKVSDFFIEKSQKSDFGLTFPEEMPLFGPSRRPFLRTRMQKTATCKTVPVLYDYATLVRFCKWSFFAYVYAKTASEMIQKVDLPLET